MALVTFARQGLYTRRLYWDLIRDPNLVMLHVLNETSGTTTFDRCTKNLLNGTTSGTPTLGASLGSGFNGITFSAASSQYISLGTPSSLAFLRASAFSVVALANVNDTAALKSIVSRFKSGANNGGWHMSFLATEVLEVTLQDTNQNQIKVDSSSALTTGTLLMPGCSYSGSGAATGVTLYNNGVSIADTDITDTMTVDPAYGSSTTGYIAAFNDTNYMDGSLAMVGVFNVQKAAADFRRWAALAGRL